MKPARPRRVGPTWGRRELYIGTLVAGVVNLLAVSWFQRQAGHEDPMVSVVFPLSAVVCVLVLLWLLAGRPLALAERLMFVVVCVQVLAGLLLAQSADPVELGAQLSTAYWLSVALCLLGYLMFSVQVASRLSLGILAVAVAVPWLRGLGAEHPEHLLRQQMSAVTIMVLAYSLALYRTRYFAEQRERRLLEEVAHTDQLTGLANRRALYPAIEERLAGGGPLAVLLADLDHFKAINDRFGHGTGDAVLVHAAQLCRRALPPTGLAGRWGGEEFLILLPSTGRDEALRWAEDLRRTFEGVPGPHGEATTLSVGLSLSQPGDGLAQLVARADAGLYRAKALGRNRTEFGG